MQSQIEKLRLLQSEGSTDILSTLRMVEINPIEICNRKCEFCPRADDDLYPNQNLKIAQETIYKIANDLQEINFDGRVGFVGFGEPTLHKELCQLIKIIKTVDNIKWIEVNTNGDFLDKNKIKNLADAGCTTLTVSMYDNDISKTLYELAEGIDIEIVPRHCYPEKFELKLVNRIDMLREDKKINHNRNCYLTFYKMFIDWNGDVLVCSEDWGRESNVGNVLTESIKDIWLGRKLLEYRKNLIHGNRSNCGPCNKCNINGTLFGKTQAERFRHTYDL